MKRVKRPTSLDSIQVQPQGSNSGWRSSAASFNIPIPIGRQSQPTRIHAIKKRASKKKLSYGKRTKYESESLPRVNQANPFYVPTTTTSSVG
jgi:hypothetical protein